MDILAEKEQLFQTNRQKRLQLVIGRHKNEKIGIYLSVIAKVAKESIKLSDTKSVLDSSSIKVEKCLTPT